MMQFAAICPKFFDFRFWQILLQKSVEGTGPSAISLMATTLIAGPNALYATPTLRNTQSMSWWR